MFDAKQHIIDTVNRELAEFQAIDDAARELLTRPTRRPCGASVVYSIRLDPDMVAVLERRAAAKGLPPSVLARNLLRIGLQGRRDTALEDVVERVEAVARELRNLIA